jgi:threonine/homoserine/homoserine lactone efflux protein
VSIEFLLTSIIIIALPGTGVLYTVAIGLSRGFQSSIAAAFGCVLGSLPAIVLSILGLATILHTSAVAFQVIKYLGAAYLFYMAWNVLRNGGAMDPTEEKIERSFCRIVATGMLTNVLNPKHPLFFLAFFPQFVSAEYASPTTQMTLLAIGFALLAFIVFSVYGAFASLARQYVLSKPAVLFWLRHLFAGAFGFLGLRLVLSDR